MMRKTIGVGLMLLAGATSVGAQDPLQYNAEGICVQALVRRALPPSNTLSVLPGTPGLIVASPASNVFHVVWESALTNKGNTVEPVTDPAVPLTHLAYGARCPVFADR